MLRVCSRSVRSRFSVWREPSMRPGYAMHPVVMAVAAAVEDAHVQGFDEQIDGLLESLEEQIRSLQAENEFLKKAVAFFTTK